MNRTFPNAPFALLLSAALISALPAQDADVKPVPAAETAALETAKPETPKQEEKRLAEVVFVLDSTGSMSGLIEGAKQKIWSIANSIITQDPAPEVKIGLISYRDKGDAYVTQQMDLTDDIDAVYAKLKSFHAGGGGGDMPESVNQALWEAVNKMSWTPKEKNVYRVIFLVGDCPPHMDYQDDVKYPETCKQALEKFVIINTVQCGNESSTTPIWQEIARKSEGQFVQIGQTGSMVARTSPFDEQIANLTKELAATVVPYGSETRQMEVMGKLKFAESADLFSQASRAEFNLNSRGRAVQGAGDLVQSINDNEISLDKIEKNALPPEMQKLSPEELEKIIKEKQQKRAELNAQIQDLSKKRATWLAEDAKTRTAEAKKLRAERRSGVRFFRAEVAAPSEKAAAHGGARMLNAVESPAPADDSPAFDDSVSEIITEQMNKEK